MVSVNQVDRYFQFVKVILLKHYESILYTTSIKTCLLSGFGQSNAVIYMIIAYTVGYMFFVFFVALSQISQMSMATCSLLRQSRSHTVLFLIKAPGALPFSTRGHLFDARGRCIFQPGGVYL